jgi:hypothetical protein
MWIGCLFLVIGLVGFGVGLRDWTRYHHGALPDPILLGTSLLRFLGATLCLVAAVVSFFA